MSHRPRLAADGRVLLPEDVTYDPESNFVRARLSEQEADPFDWTADRLLLAESFARLDLLDVGAVLPWFEGHGFVDRFDFFGGSAEVPDSAWLATRRPDELADQYDEVAQEQDNVAWHLATLARLSERRRTMEWDPNWGRLLIGGPDTRLIVGGPDAGAELMSREWVDDPRHSKHPELARIERRFVEEQDRLFAAVDGWPVVGVSEPGWFGHWRPKPRATEYSLRERARDKGNVVGGIWDHRARVLGSTWDQTVELERTLIVPYVTLAVERQFSVEREWRDVAGVMRSVLVPRDKRAWQSVLAPIYLQLFEALRRITEGEPGGAICRECGRPFLVLDARRRFFCNERERYRHAKREQRKRLSAQDSIPPSEPGEVGSNRGDEG
jgi:hypothetical protein